jgi:N-acetylmuramic acid 6-phosphate etherase
MTDDLPLTEGVDARSAELDTLDSLAIVTLMNDADAEVPSVVCAALPDIARAVDATGARMQDGGRLIYVGAGTSGRLAMLDAVECVPTFGLPPGRVIALVAGGEAALTRSVEGAEDDTRAAARDIAAANVSSADVVVGLAASGRTPYVVAALEAARQRGAFTVGIANSAPAPVLEGVEIAITLPTGPEVLAGSTRLKAGTAQKLVLNMLSTAVMVRLGRVFGNRMIDVAVTNRKLRRRAEGIVADLVGCDAPEAGRLLDAAGQDVRLAVLMGLADLDAAGARQRLESVGGDLRSALRTVPEVEAPVRGRPSWR